VAEMLARERGTKPDKYQDICALSIIVYEMLTHRLPHGKLLEKAR